MTVIIGLGLQRNRGFVVVSPLSPFQLFVTPWTVAYQGPPSMEFSRQKYWSGLPFTFPGDLPDSGIEPRSSALQADSLPSEPPGKDLYCCPTNRLNSIEFPDFRAS